MRGEKEGKPRSDMKCRGSTRKVYEFMRACVEERVRARKQNKRFL